MGNYEIVSRKQAPTQTVDSAVLLKQWTVVSQVCVAIV